ncbi:molybdopterin molybdotransferase MoeA [Fibrella sp. HMF5335]|uniref:Molybdopterin molybdenumtransferase n=1 Tax=Fibrella rubiginis TaxID=2817060 RepID=A0A939GGQ3_9BACT|nr:molybdopterin molybdotransferase MoeA [Fibrella rubiginis]MBO0936138.1 molybdopterin molybdotransferase MoeA [Fibrella rubiginis]
MNTVSDADRILAEHTLVLSTESVPFDKALGRILAETIVADRDFPPFDRVAMDGIAIHYDALADGKTTFTILGTQRAGEPAQPLPDPLGCLEVMTGAILPTGADTVIRYEDLSIVDGIATLTAPDEVQRQLNVHHQGIDRRPLDVLLSAGVQLRPVELAVVASVGQTSVSVRRRPRVAVIATGDELVDIDKTPLPHQIRHSNAYLLQAALRDLGLDASVHQFPDDMPTITTGISRLLASHEVLISTGGVSAGKADFIPDVLEGLGIRRHFHKIEQRPGKPFWFGSSAGTERVVFALPGNPVSTTMCFYRYVRPYLQRAMGAPADPPLFVQLAEPVTFKPNLTYFIPARIEASPDGQLLAHPLPGSGSADFANLTAADAFVELPAHESLFPAGTAAQAWSIG